LTLLQSITVKKLATIEDCSLSFAPGLNVLSGETGAGKSLVVGAIDLLAGARANADMVRSHAKEAEVAAVFDVFGDKDIAEFLDSLGLSAEEGVLVARRLISYSGKSRAFLQDTPVSVAALAMLGERLMNIYGQHEAQGMLRPELHADMLDAFGGLASLSENVSMLHRKTSKLIELKGELEKKRSDSLARIDYLKFVISEINSANPQPGELELLSRRRTLLSAASQIKEYCLQAATELADSSDSFCDRAEKLAGRAEKLAAQDPGLNKISKALRELAMLAGESASECRSHAANAEDDPAALADVEERIDLLKRLAKKYGGSLESVLEFASNVEKELGEIQSLDDTLSQAGLQLQSALEELAKLAKDLTVGREKAANDLSSKMAKELAELAIPNARFEVRFNDHPEGSKSAIKIGEMSVESGGAQRVEFYLSANPGQEPKPLAKVASGGELSRISLALKRVLALAFPVPTLIFDEVDAGLSGKQAAVVGDKLYKVARNHQVVVITHLPQIASKADHHLLVTKKVQDSQTKTIVTHLQGEDRIQELARMLGGKKITPAILVAAKEMLESKTGFSKRR